MKETKYTKHLEQMILGKTLNMVIRFLLNSLSREVSLFLDLDLDLDVDLGGYGRIWVDMEGYGWI